MFSLKRNTSIVYPKKPFISLLLQYFTKKQQSCGPYPTLGPDPHSKCSHTTRHVAPHLFVSRTHFQFSDSTCRLSFPCSIFLLFFLCFILLLITPDRKETLSSNQKRRRRLITTVHVTSILTLLCTSETLIGGCMVHTTTVGYYDGTWQNKTIEKCIIHMVSRPRKSPYAPYYYCLLFCCVHSSISIQLNYLPPMVLVH